jgi:hypothetical protein
VSESLIGKTVWRFDEYHRVYRKDENGLATGGPIYREHWQPIVVFGENRRSWLAGYERYPYKIPKTGPHPGFALTEQELDDACWASEHRYRVYRAVESRMHDDLDFLKQIAAMVDYK